MKKGTILRNDAPHAVNMPEGAKVATRRVKKAPADVLPEAPAPTPKSQRQTPQPPATAPETLVVPVSIAAKAKAKSKASPRAKAPAKARAAAVTPVLPIEPTEPRQAPLPPIDTAAIWEKDNPIKTRLSQIKARNALLEEQLHRLQSPFQARGKKP